MNTQNEVKTIRLAQQIIWVKEGDYFYVESYTVLNKEKPCSFRTLVQLKAILKDEEYPYQNLVLLDTETGEEHIRSSMWLKILKKEGINGVSIN